eukprot:GHVQ01041108.1.p2 GENE.GHVQ01041108.1~~GHVQ01041108.1.p2  ORF type:complete len:191 (+),score=39.03 GHVQ01041108.1:162-734(+)
MTALCPTTSELYTRMFYYVETDGKSLVASGKPSSGKSDDDDFDLFGEQTAEEKDATKKLGDNKKAEVAKKTKEVINKSSLVIEVKPNSAESNLDEIHKLVKQIQMPGLKWGEAHKKVPVAFGLYKLQVSCTIIDELVVTEEITDQIEALGMDYAKAAARKAKRETEEDEDEEEEDEGLVQSADIVSFNKL